MSTGEDEDSVTLESVNSVTLTQDSDGSIILHCPPHEGDESFEVTMTATADSDITEEGVAQIQILQSSDPQNSEEISPVSQAWFTTKEDKDTLVNKGHKWKQGMWSKEEIDLLMSNIQQYVKGRGMEDPAEIIFEMSKEERKDFYRSVAWGLNRPLFAVYRRVLRMYDNRNHVGKSSEDVYVFRLRQKHGNDWATIGAALGRSASSVKDRCRLMKDTCNTGKWSEEEERRLSDSVYALAGVCPGRAVTGGVSWAAVADLVGTRSEKQCRSKWLNYLNWKQSGGTEWTKDQDLSLVHRIVELDVDDENELKWEELAGGWSSVRSPQWLRSKWWSIKRQVANHKELPFHVLLKGLQELMETQVPLGAGTGPGSPSPSLQIRVTRLEECCSSAPRPVTALQIPLQITHLASDSAGASDTETITLNTAALQTLQILPSFHLHPTGTPGTYFLQTAANQSLPLSLSSNPTVTLTASSSPSSPEHIILHSLSTEGLCSNDSVIIQTVTSEHTSPEPLCQSQLVVEMQGEEPEQNFLIGSSEDGATETPEPMTDSFTAKVLDSPSQEEQVVHSGIAKGAVLIVSPTNVSSTLTDLILENQDGSD
ncbi:cyclin-D-binding Myb-like transcription factor 1 isoform 3-T4 [Salvelinus alpinus]